MQHHLQQRRLQACLRAWQQAALRCRRNARVVAACLRQQALQLLGTCFDGWLRVVVAQQGHGQLKRALALERELRQAGAELQAEQLGRAATLQQVQLLEQQQAQLQQEVYDAGAGVASGADAAPAAASPGLAAARVLAPVAAPWAEPARPWPAARPPQAWCWAAS